MVGQNGLGDNEGVCSVAPSSVFRLGAVLLGHGLARIQFCSKTLREDVILRRCWTMLPSTAYLSEVVGGE